MAKAINFTKSGWLRRYLEFRNSEPFAPFLPSYGVRVLEDTGVHHELDESIYYFLQPTGLLYGFPIGLPFPEDTYPQLQFMDAVDRVHLIFLEALFACLVADRHYLLSGLTDEEEHFAPAVEVATSFFAPAVQGPHGWFLGRWIGSLADRGAQHRLERTLRRRIGLGAELLQLPGRYYNSFLFLDLYYCMLWQRRLLVEPEEATAHLQELRAEQLERHELLICLMAAASGASGAVTPEEQRLLDWFLKSAALPRERLAALRGRLARGLTLDQLEIGPMPWLVRRFMLEATLMMLLVDRDLSDGELAFLAQVVERLELWSEELQQSRVALEVFILHQEPHLQIFRNRPALLNVGDHLRDQATMAVRKNLQRIVQEIRETQELYHLLMKSTHHPLTAEEKRKVRQQLLDIIKTIPALAIFALPGGAFLLPLVIRLLPFNVLPSAFED